MRMTKWALVLPLVGCGVAADETETEATKDEPTGEARSAAYVQPQNLRIGGHHVIGCWDANVPSDWAQAGLTAVEDTWETESGLKMAWGCDPTWVQLKVVFGASGSTWQAIPSGNRFGRQMPFVEVQRKLTTPAATPSAPGYRAVLARAVGFGLGIMPEDARADIFSWESCGTPTLDGGVRLLSTFDEASIMNQCANNDAPPQWQWSSHPGNDLLP